MKWLCLSPFFHHKSAVTSSNSIYFYQFLEFQLKFIESNSFNSTFELNLLDSINLNLAKLKETEFNQIGFNRIWLSFTK